MAFLNRRTFLASAGALSFAGAAAGLAGRAHASTDQPYRALVGIMLAGGLDHADTLLPGDRADYDTLASHRPGIFDAHGEDREFSRLLPLAASNSGEHGGRTLALPPSLPKLHDLFRSGDLAVVSGVGPLLEPVTRADMEAGRAALPPRLHSHNDQQSTWAALAPEGARLGWGGLFADAALRRFPSDDSVFSTVTTSGNSVFLASRTAQVFRTSDRGPSLPMILKDRPSPGEFSGIGSGEGNDRAREIMRRYFARTDIASPNLLERDSVLAHTRAIPTTRRFAEALDGAPPLDVGFPATVLGRQLQAIAQSIAVRDQVGNRRQIYFASMGGFDTHSNQATSITKLHEEIDGALDAFARALRSLGAWNSVTTFTMSDFGRTVVGNDNGTDHGWGGHHFVMGGSVAGGRIVGDIPGMDIDGGEYTRYRGRLIPTTSVEQYAASLGGWFGLDDAALRESLPNLGNFDRRLGLF